MTQKQPSEIAREALKRLAASKLPPTPANYQACYYEIAGLPNLAGFPDAQLRKIALALTAHGPEQQARLDQLDEAIGRHSWQGVEDALTAYVFALSVARDGAIRNVDSREASLPSLSSDECLQDLARLVEDMLPALGNEDEQAIRRARNLIKALRGPEHDIDLIRDKFTDFSKRLAYVAELQAEIKAALLKLLHLVIENVGVLAVDDNWLKGQIDALLFAVNPPLDLRRLDSVERRVRDIMAKQSVAKARSREAQEEMRQMLAAFIERLALMSMSSSNFQYKIEDSAQRLEKVKSLEELAPLLTEVIHTTRSMAEEAAQERDQLQMLQRKAESTEAEIAKLHQELISVSDQARHDPLTDALNRKGLDEALMREIANMQRQGTPLSVGLLDIDNFKKLNDKLGHETGDAALVHLVNVLLTCLRPMDCLARYGGEEFVVLMPDTTLDGGIKAMARFQRELTKHFFLAGGERILITFSAGVAQFGEEESGADAINRADRAMYLAKRAGKNRVIGG